ncbi:MAG: peroxiredoxin [Candidatus Binataceae bacterium]
MPPPVEESRAPEYAAAVEISLLDQHGQPHRLADYRGRCAVIYFYPKDDTPGCTVEGKEFRDLHEQFVALNCAIVGVSTDTVESHRHFAEKHAFPFTLLADAAGDLARAFGVLNGKTAKRVTFVLGRDGRVARTFADVAPRGHAQQVLNFVRTFLESHLMIGG